jgi:hypothetical protein
MVVERQHLRGEIPVPVTEGISLKKNLVSSDTRTIRLAALLRPYWRLLTIAFVAMLVQGAA